MSGESTILVVDDDPGVLRAPSCLLSVTFTVQAYDFSVAVFSMRSVSELTRVAELMGIPPEP